MHAFAFALPPRPVRRLLVVVGLALLAGCAALGRDAGPPADELDRVAQDLVFTLVQLPESNPLTTTVQLSDPATPFGREVVRLVREAGYGVQSVPDDRGSNHLRYRAQTTASELGTETRYGVAIGDVSVERAYDRVGGRLVPVSDQRVQGSRSREVELNDDLFGLDDASPVHGVAFDDELAPVLTDASGVPSPGIDAPAASPFGALVKRNLYDGLNSNYAELFVAYDDVAATDLSFPNDSMRLGDVQKRTIAEYAARLRPDTDLLSVVGCSHGNTAIRNGNGVLALGRANRVKEALVYAGVPPAVVLDEGCWAGSSHATFPKRGVVLTLKRRAG